MRKDSPFSSCGLLGLRVSGLICGGRVRRRGRQCDAAVSVDLDIPVSELGSGSP